MSSSIQQKMLTILKISTFKRKLIARENLYWTLLCKAQKAGSLSDESINTQTRLIDMPVVTYDTLISLKNIYISYSRYSRQLIEL